mmetsp:Transcript_53539/g.168570  ORF Transcript_53539/g.168570 Transcript_53539/m.168570 type:complete len:264 (-) Transcript_53539:97-888(-)
MVAGWPLRDSCARLVVEPPASTRAAPAEGGRLRRAGWRPLVLLLAASGHVLPNRRPWASHSCSTCWSSGLPGAPRLPAWRPGWRGPPPRLQRRAGGEGLEKASAGEVRAAGSGSAGWQFPGAQALSSFVNTVRELPGKALLTLVNAAGKARCRQAVADSVPYLRAALGPDAEVAGEPSEMEYELVGEDQDGNPIAEVSARYPVRWGGGQTTAQVRARILFPAGQLQLRQLWLGGRDLLHGGPPPGGVTPGTAPSPGAGTVIDV